MEIVAIPMLLQSSSKKQHPISFIYSPLQPSRAIIIVVHHNQMWQHHEQQ
jgi:hypothetical protein